ncbi:polyprenol monophosphomannose synthase [candidate division WOR-3 bacterium]|nr:polyprenol monophosphomannose synthase [candidate division WOR-3 bacterium]
MKADSLVIIPTYNENENIESIIDAVLLQGNEFAILIVDDNSPDGTGDTVKKIQKKKSRRKDKRVHLIEREKKLGLGSAYIEGFRWALKKNYDFVFEMDADFSHDPSTLPILRNTIIEENADLVLGSRYKKGVNVVNWPMSRLILSYFANLFAKTVTGVPLSDLTSGFKGIRKTVIEKLDFDKIDAEGYGFQIEIHFYTYWNGFKIKEIPIVFTERRSGNSKMSKKIIWEAFWLVWKLGIRRLLKKI